MKKTGLILFSAAMILSFSACNNAQDSVDQAENVNEQKEDQNSNAVDPKDAEFAVKATDGGMAEVEISKLAKEKSTNQQVKDFADMMIRDHSAANEKLNAITMAKNITVPTSLSSENQDHKNDLAQRSGSDFDKAYMDLMEKDHEKTISMFEDAVNNVKDPELNNFAKETLPTLRGHLADCKKVQDALK